MTIHASTTTADLLDVEGHQLRRYIRRTPGVGTQWAVFSKDMLHRYALGVRWEPGKYSLVVIGLNPSTATHEVLDPTVTRCVKRAKSLGWGGLTMLNLFAFRATDPTVMKAASDPVGVANDAALAYYCTQPGLTGLEPTGAMVVAAWGTDGDFQQRGLYVRRKLEQWGVVPHVFKLTKDGHPGHPLYLPYALQPVPWPS